MVAIGDHARPEIAASLRGSTTTGTGPGRASRAGAGTQALIADARHRRATKPRRGDEERRGQEGFMLEWRDRGSGSPCGSADEVLEHRRCARSTAPTPRARAAPPRRAPRSVASPSSRPGRARSARAQRVGGEPLPTYGSNRTRPVGLVGDKLSASVFTIAVTVPGATPGRAIHHRDQGSRLALLRQDARGSRRSTWASWRRLSASAVLGAKIVTNGALTRAIPALLVALARTEPPLRS